MERTARPRLALGVSGGMVLLLGVGLLAVWLWPSQGSELALAQSRWQVRPFDRYHLVLEDSGGLRPCRQEIEVAGDQIVQVIANSCPYPAATTVSDLFATVRRYVAKPPCGPNGCACDGALGVEVAYHPQLGYPQQVAVRSQISERWKYGDYWRNLWQNRGQVRCAVMGYSGPELRVVALAPVAAAARR